MVGALGGANAPVAPWGRDERAPAASASSPPTALSGLAHGSAGAGVASGIGSGHGRLGGSHAVRQPSIRMGATAVNGRLPPEVIQRIVRQNFGRFRRCYEDGLRSNATLSGRVSIRFVIDRSGSVVLAAVAGSTLPNTAVVQCVQRSFMSLGFPQPEGANVTVVYPLNFEPNGWTPPPNAEVNAATTSAPVAPPVNDPVPDGTSRAPLGRGPDLEVKPPETPAYTGQFANVMDMLDRHEISGAVSIASEWHRHEPGDVLALVALGETLEAQGDRPRAARAYGSLIDLFPSRADLRRFAGERLDHMHASSSERGPSQDDGASELGIDTYRKALAERSDHPSSHRLLAFALLRRGRYAEAFEVASHALTVSFPNGRFPAIGRILAEDLGLIAAAWQAAEPSKRDTIGAKARAAGALEEKEPSLRFVLTWETDSNDVDFHVTDARGNHAFYQQPTLATGGQLYADVTQGYGPECFTIRGPRASRVGPYTMRAHYYSRGPMGYGMGKVEVIDHDGAGHLTFDERPFVVMNDHAYVELGTAM
jgi:tetratricopeptide (TPR) repeat protein